MFCAEDDGPFSQLFDEEEIERRETYSDTDGSNVDEDAYDDLFDDEEFWERFDKRMSKEYEKEKARKWPTAAGYPDYVDSIEERKAVFSLTSVDFDVPYDASVPGSNGERYLGNREVYSMR